jgi:GMP synthase-like glutamine amidotransferase
LNLVYLLIFCYLNAEDKKILIIQNITREGPGLLSQIISEKNLKFDLVDLSIGDKLPDISQYSAIIVLGGPSSANDTDETMLNELAFIKKSRELNIPYLGICLGLQTLVKAKGGAIRRNEVPEIGFKNPEGEPYSINLTEEGKKDPLFAGLDSQIRVFHLHGETVDLRPNMKLLALGDSCKNQVVKLGDNAYGLQCHFELTPEMLNIWLDEDPDLLKLNKEEVLKEWEQVKSEYTNTGLTLFNNFFKIAGL